MSLHFHSTDFGHPALQYSINSPWSITDCVVWYPCSTGTVLLHRECYTKVRQWKWWTMVFLAVTKQLYECSTRLSVYHRIIVKFSGVITNDRSDVHAKSRGQRPKVKVTEDTQFSHFQTITPVWSHTWWWKDAQSLMWHRRGVLLFFKVIHQISRSCVTKNCWFSPKLSVFGMWLMRSFYLHVGISYTYYSQGLSSLNEVTKI